MASVENTCVEPVELKAFQRVLEMAIAYMNGNYDRNEPIVLFRTPEQLEKEINIPIGDKGVGFDGIMKELEQTIKFQVRTGHIRFYNQLWAGTDKAAVIGEWLTAILNSSMYTYEVSPVFTMMELYILERLRKFAGWTDGDGAFAPGGAHCNLLAMLAARNHTLPRLRKTGIQAGDHLVAFTSAQSHYTVPRAGMVLGIGMQSCIKVACDKFGRMIPAELEAAIEKAKKEGHLPFFINATAGSTVLGAYDPFVELAAISKKHNIWLHIDACWGGHALLSPKHRHLMNGCENANSIAWTATKCFGLPQQCAAVIINKRNMLQACNACNEDYLFHEHEQKDYDLGERTLNCGRRVDAFKLWVSWKVYGDEGFAARVDHAFDNAVHMAARLKAHPEQWQLLVEPESLNVCFWYIPKKYRALAHGAERDQKLDEATVEIRKRMQRAGKCLVCEYSIKLSDGEKQVNYSDLAGVPGHFFRMITCNPNATKADMDFVLDHIAELGETL